MRLRWLAALACALALTGTAFAAPPRPADLLKRVAFEQRLNAQAPMDLTFRDAQGRSVRLGQYFGERPVILVLGYYGCENLCGVVMNGLLASLKALSFDAGKEYDVVSVSIDPSEGSQLARANKANYLERYDRPGAARGWHFLTGEQPQIERLAQAAGFRYFYDPDIGQYVHAAGVMVLTPKGRFARYFYGVRYPPRDLRLGLVEASEARIGSPVDALLLLCCQYDPSTGKYGVLIWNVVRLACLATVLLLGASIGLTVWRERRRKRMHANGAQ